MRIPLVYSRFGAIAALQFPGVYCAPFEIATERDIKGVLDLGGGSIANSNRKAYVVIMISMVIYGYKILLECRIGNGVDMRDFNLILALMITVVAPMLVGTSDGADFGIDNVTTIQTNVVAVGRIDGVSSETTSFTGTYNPDPSASNTISESVTVKSNEADWILTLSDQNTGTNEGYLLKGTAPLTNPLTVANSTSLVYMPLTDPVIISRGTAVGEKALNILFKQTGAWEDTIGSDYTIKIDYTLTYTA